MDDDAVKRAMERIASASESRPTEADVQAALTRSNVEIPSGRIEGTGRELTVKTIGELTTAEQFGKIVVATVEGRPIQLHDVARVAVGAEDDRKVVRFQGEPAVGLGIIRQSKAPIIFAG